MERTNDSRGSGLGWPLLTALGILGRWAGWLVTGLRGTGASSLSNCFYAVLFLFGVLLFWCIQGMLTLRNDGMSWFHPTLTCHDGIRKLGRYIGLTMWMSGG